MFGFSRRRMKLGRLKVQLADSTQGTKSPIRHNKRLSHSNVENVISASNHSDDINCQCSSSSFDLDSCTSGNSQKWMTLSTAGDKPTPRFNVISNIRIEFPIHAATVLGSKMVVVGGESGRGLLEDVQVLNFDKLTWNTAVPKLYLSPTSLPLKIPACKGHSVVSWGKKALLIGGKTEPGSDRVSVWSFDIETECWSHVETKGDIPVARSGHTTIKAGTVLILFGGEDAKGRKLNDLHMFDLKSLMWLPLQCTGTGPSPRSNHVAAIYNDKILFIFGGASKSRTMNDLYSLDFETMVWSRIKTRGFQPTPRASCCGVLYGSKWYIAGGGSRKKRHSETLVFDVLKVEWAVAVPSSPSSVTANKNFSLVLMQHKEWVFLVAFGGTKKEPSNQVEILTMVKNEQSMSQQLPHDKDPLLFKNCSSTIGFPSHINNGASRHPIDSVARHNLASAMEHRSSGRKSLSESSIDPNLASGNVSLRKQFHQEEENNAVFKMQKSLEVDKYNEADDSSLSNNTSSQRNKPLDAGVQVAMAEPVANVEEMQTVLDLENTKTHQKQAIGDLLSETDDVMLTETDCKSIGLTTSNIYQMCETKMAALLRKNGVLEGQLAAALASRDTAEKKSSSAVKSRQDMERKLADSVKEVEFLKEKLAAAEIAQEEANSLSNIVHSDNVRLEHDVAFLKAVLDDTQKELHSTRGVLAGERARAFQLQVEVFHLKQRLQSVESRAPTPRKPFHA